MAHLIEYRKVNDTCIPLYFKFGTVSTKYNLTSDKYMSLENWLNIFDQLDEIIANGYSSSSSSSKRSKSFDIENGRLTIKTRWVKTSDSVDLGSQILKILNLSSSSVGKYFLKIDVKLSSNFERLFAQLKEQGKLLDGQIQVNKPNHEQPNVAKQENLNGNYGESSEMLAKKEDVKSDVKLESTNSPTYGRYEDIDLHEASVEEYIPVPASSTAASTSVIAPTYHPEKNYAQIEMNQIQSEYSPTFVNNQHKTPTAKSDKSTEQELTYRPSTRKKKSSECDESRKLHSKKNRLRGRSRELFGTSDEDDDESHPERVSSSSSSHKSKRKKDTPQKTRTKSNRDSSTQKKKMIDPRSQESTDMNDISIRNLMEESIEDILATFPEHEKHLTELYEKHSKHWKRHYKPTDIPDMAALDIVTPDQFQAMVDFLEKKLVRNLEEEHNYSDVIFESILPEWAYAVFCKKYHCSRSEAVKRIQLQNIAVTNRSDTELFFV